MKHDTSVVCVTGVHPTAADGAPESSPGMETRPRSRLPASADAAHPARHAPDVSVPPGTAFRVVWTKGADCRALAELLDPSGPTPVASDIATACVSARANLLVTRHLGSSDLCSVAVPHGFAPDETRAVVAAVGGGPHSSLAAAVAHALATRLGVPGRALYGHRGPDERPAAERVLSAISSQVPDLPTAAVEAASPAAMVGSLAPGTLLVVGAPGGSWFQRQFFGPGARIRARAPHGIVVVRHSPPRVYQVMRPPTAYGPQMRVVDAGLLSPGTPIVVAEEGRLVGTVSPAALAAAYPHQELGDIMEDPVFLGAEERLDDIDVLLGAPGGAAVPVVDRRGRLVGLVAADDLPRLAS